jgi:uncharacterized protein
MSNQPAKTKMPFHIMAKPIGPICNLDCSYCYYLEKEKLFPAHRNAADFRISDATLELFVRQYIQSQPNKIISFAWQGGEPTLMGIEFFRRVMELQKRFCPPEKHIENALQTNGTLLDPDWCKFLKENHFLLGLSIDGPRELHDRYRVTRGGKPSFDLVMHGLKLLKDHGVDFNTLTVVHRELAYHPREVYEFLREHGSAYMQFIPLVERFTKSEEKELANPPLLKVLSPKLKVAPWSVEPLQFGLFLSEMFDQWVRQDVGKIFVQTFDVQLGIWAGRGAGLCIFAETCGDAMAMEHNGDLYACDHFVFPEYRLGNIQQQSMSEMVESPIQKKFGLDKQNSLPTYCKRCEVRFACNGECPKNRFAVTPDGEPGLNYLCAGYKHFLNHIRPQMEIMAQLINSGRPASGVMQIMAQREKVKIGGK